MPLRHHDNLHSKLVAWLKVVFPLLALLLLSTLFLFSRGVDPEDAIPYAEVDVEDRLAEPRMVGAGFSGKTASGAAITLTAAEARPGSNDQVTATDVKAAIQFPAGGTVNLTAPAADLHSATESAALTGGVVLTDSAGYRVETAGLDLSSTGILAQSHGPILAVGPLGSLSAKTMVLTESKDSAESYEMVFKGDVKVLYLPPKDLP